MAEPEPAVGEETAALPEPDAGRAPAGRKRDVEPVPLVAGLLFIALAVLLMSGADLAGAWFRHDLGWLLLIGGGLALLVNELRKSRRRR